METLNYLLRELVQKQGRGYEFTFFENESMILLFWVGCGYDFTERRKESSGTGVISSGIKSGKTTLLQDNNRH